MAGAMNDKVRVAIAENAAALRSAPQRSSAAGGRRTPDTKVKVCGYDIRGVPGPHEHMYVTFDDGHEALIARGGPGGAGLPRVSAGVTPEKLSRDYGKCERVLFEGHVPAQTAQQAASGARRHAAEVNRSSIPYLGLDSNSNSYAADVVEDLFGGRVGDGLTPGWMTRLKPRR